MPDEPQKNGLLNLPARAAEFIKLVINKMRYRKKVRDEVLEELTAHFQDALRNCKTEEEKQKAAAQLVEEFGDPKLLAILLRRAKKRCRPFWRTVVARTLQSAAILIICFIFYVTWFLSGKPQITTDYLAQYNQMVRPNVDDSQNAAPLYNKAIEVYNQPSDDFLRFFAQNFSQFVPKDNMRIDPNLPSQIRQLFVNPNDPNFAPRKEELAKETTKNMGRILRIKLHQITPPQKHLIKKWINHQRQALEAVTAANEKPHYWRQYQTGSDGRAYLHAENEDYDKALIDLKTCYRLGRHFKTNQNLIEQLVGMSIETIATETLRDILSNYRLTSPQLQTLQQNFERLSTNEVFTVDFSGEKLMLLDEIQRCYTESGHIYIPRMSALGDDMGHYRSAIAVTLDTIISPQNWLSAMKVLFTHPNKKQTRQKAKDFYDFIQALAPKSPAQIRAEDMDIEEKINEIVRGNMLLTIFCPAIGKVVEISHRNKSQIHATIAIIAILRHKAEKDDFPDSLQQLLSSGYISQIPIDVYTDKPLIYRKTEDSFILYSVSENFTDDGGQPARDDKGNPRTWADDADAVFWPVLHEPLQKETGPPSRR